MDVIRVLRIIEYVGPRERVEATIRNSIQGSWQAGDLTISATTLGQFPEIMEQGPSDPPLQLRTERDEAYIKAKNDKFAELYGRKSD
jgi:hypothetical protein